MPLNFVVGFVSGSLFWSNLDYIFILFAVFELFGCIFVV